MEIYYLQDHQSYYRKCIMYIMIARTCDCFPQSATRYHCSNVVCINQNLGLERLFEISANGVVSTINCVKIYRLLVKYSVKNNIAYRITK